MTLDDFAGLWIDDSGRVVHVTIAAGAARVSITKGGIAYSIHLLVGTRPTLDLPAELTGEEALQIEAGNPGLGPTFRLTPDGSDGLLPSVGMGLYDDFDDDLGVPWAFPLSRYRRANEVEEREWRRR